jgi:(R,R)-butanediol dehydrogenase/meso-butanediol dehydrogenase/diacetyl reductase
MIARGNLPVKQVMTSQIDLEEVVTKGFDALVDPTGDQLKILVGAP